MNTYTIQQIVTQGKLIHVSAPNYSKAKQWFDEYIQRTNGNIQNIQAEIKDEIEEVYISNVKEAEEWSFLLQKKNNNFLADIFTEGYDYDTDCYVFAVIDAQTKEVFLQADSEEEAVDLATDIFKKQDVTTKKERHYFSCSEDEKITIKGDTMDIKYVDELADELRNQFPNGMTVTLEDESLSNLKQYADIANLEDELVYLKGMIEAGDNIMAGANGLLHAELRLQPKDYDMLEACEATYFSHELSNLGLETNTNATTVMLHTEEDFKQSRVQTLVGPRLLNNLFIEGHPYKEVMQKVNEIQSTIDSIKAMDINEDKILKYYFNNEYLNSVPEWKRNLAKESTRTTMQILWVEKLGPAYREEHKMYKETQEQAAKEFGYKDVNSYIRDFEWSGKNSEQQNEKLRKIAERHSELWKPYQMKSQKESFLYHYREAELQRAFIERFNHYAQKAVTDVRVFQRVGDEWAIRCKINGKQMMGKTLTAGESQSIIQRTYPKTGMSDLAQKYYANEIKDAMDPGMKHTLRR